MAEDAKNENKKSSIAEREGEILSFWKKESIFKKTLEKPSPKGKFTFYDGPPFATGSPHYGHILAGTIKDVIPRFKTMQGFFVPRRWGWDCHGLPIENLVEKELGLKSKKDIEDLGIEKFNAVARESVLKYDHEWKNIIPRTGRFVDMNNAYLTMDPEYSESIWWSFKSLYDKKLIYKGFKSMMLCPHCETTLSNFEVSQSYKDITDISVYVKFALVGEAETFILAWTTTPWTLPGNVALAVNPKIEYVKVRIENENYILAKERLGVLKDKKYEILETFSGKDLIGKRYVPIFEYYKNEKIQYFGNGWKIVDADFVTTTDGTGVVHIAPAFGEDDYALSLEKELPFIQHVGVDGKFKKEVSDFAGMSVKPIDTKEDSNAHQKADIEIIKFLAGKNFLFAKEKLVHAYPHCWRCDTPLLNYASSSWFVKVSDIKKDLVSENGKVNWVPEEIGSGRFGKWLENARDWAISRSRYWGAPLPVWFCKDCGNVEVIGSVQDIRQRTRRNRFFVIRHGEADHNVQNILSSDKNNPHHLTDLGREQVILTAQALKEKKIDLIITSPLVRTKETAEVVIEQLAYKGEVVVDERLTELDFGDLNLKPFELYHNYFDSVKERLTKRLPNGECINDVRKRMGELIYEIDSRYEGKTIVLVTHDGPATVLFGIAEGADDKKILELWGMDRDFLSTGQEAELDFANIPHNKMYELDLHRPYIDDITFKCTCRETLRRVPEVFDTWYESGSMPYSSIHYPFNPEQNKLQADFIAEGQDQTRGWFYSMLVLSVGLFGISPYKNVVVNGTILAEDGQKMSKRLKNYPDITYVLDRYGGDALRYYLLSSPVVKAEDVSFSEKGVDEVLKKVIMRLQNVCTFYSTYGQDGKEDRVENPSSKNVLDQWIISRLFELLAEVTKSFEAYEIDRATRPIADFVDDLSTWYLRRSRDRFKSDDKEDKTNAISTTRFVLREFAKIIAPVMPFLAESIYLEVKDKKDEESVHLSEWPKLASYDEKVLSAMKNVRDAVSVGLEARAVSGIKIRQPLQSITLNSEKFNFSEEHSDLVKDELNIKEIMFSDNVADGQDAVLETKITPELKAEGDAREFIRALQELRKKNKLDPHDKITLVVETKEEGKTLIEKFKKEIMKTALVEKILYDKTKGETIEIGENSFLVEIQKH